MDGVSPTILAPLKHAVPPDSPLVLTSNHDTRLVPDTVPPGPSLPLTPPARTNMLDAPLAPPPPEHAPGSLALMALTVQRIPLFSPPPPAPALGARVHHTRPLAAPLPHAALGAAVVRPAVGRHGAALTGVAQALAARGRAHKVPVAVA